MSRIHLPTWLERHSVEIVPKLLFEHGKLTLLEADINVITRDCPKRIEVLEGRDIFNKSENHKVLMIGMLLEVKAIANFCSVAQAWLNLPIQVLSTTRFAGEYELGFLSHNRFTMEFREYALTPSNPSWMTLEITYVNGEDFGAKTMHVDYTCLKEFVDGWTLWNDQHNNALMKAL